MLLLNHVALTYYCLDAIDYNLYVLSIREVIITEKCILQEINTINIVPFKWTRMTGSSVCVSGKGSGAALCRPPSFLQSPYVLMFLQ